MAGGWGPDQTGNSSSALGDHAAPIGGSHRPLPRPPSRISLGHWKSRGPDSHRPCSPNTGQVNDSNSEGSGHDYLPLVRTREVEGGAARARALSQLASPPTSSLLRCACRRRPAPSAWTLCSVQRCASRRSTCAVPHPLLRTGPASAPPRPPLPGHF